MKELKVVELFAGVGGFRVGLERVKANKDEALYKIIFSNQWEPSTKRQHANEVYRKKFDSIHHSEKNIEEAVEQSEIPPHDVLVGGFPCQDYSVATSTRNAHGLIGKKGVLWWQIEKILRAQLEKPEVPPVRYLILENVDRLIKSPAYQRGRDFAMILESLNQLEYALEWRVINAADYGFPQKRRRVFLVGYHKSTSVYQEIKKCGLNYWIRNESVFQKNRLKALFEDSNKEELTLSKFMNVKAFKNFSNHDKNCSIDLDQLSYGFNLGAPRHKPSPFKNAGVFLDGRFVTFDYTPDVDNELLNARGSTLESVLKHPEEVPEEFIVFRAKNDKQLDTLLEDYAQSKSVEEVLKNKEIFTHIVSETDDSKENEDQYKESKNLEKWVRQKHRKKIHRVSREGVSYIFSEGKMTFPDSIKKPSRTIITGEGGPAPSRFKHVVRQGNILRRLLPEELELLNGFEEGHTSVEGITHSKRAFFMGNALVVGIIEDIGKSLFSLIQSFKKESSSDFDENSD